MSNVKKRIEELDLMDDFLFTEATIDSETAQLLLRMIIERATGVKVGKLIIEPQKTVNGADTDGHGIRMDVTAKEVTDAEGKTVRLFDVEPNNIKSVHLPRRSRYYQALMDVKLLDAGEDYDKLPDMWTIWILPYDPFGMDHRIYTVKNIVEENPEIEYNDGIRKLFLYTKGTKGGTKALRNLLAYIQNTTSENAVDEDLKKLHTNVERLKSNKQIGVKYMHMQEVIKYAVKEEVEEIMKHKIDEIEQEARRRAVQKMQQEIQLKEQKMQQEMQMKEQKMQQEMQMKEQQMQQEMQLKVNNSMQEAERTMKLTQLLVDAGRYEDLRLATQNETYRKQMMKELAID